MEKQQKNKDGKGVFLVIMSVATLIIAALGATFAYFTASVTGDTPVSVQSYEFATTLSITPSLPVATPKNNLIPLNDEDLFDAMGQDCIDDDGYLVCKVYDLTFSNTGAKVTLNGELVTTINDGFTNMKYQLLDSTGQAITGSNATTVPVADATSQITFADGANTIEIGAGTAESPTTATYKIVIWLSNVKTDAQDEQGKNYEGKLTFTSSNGSQLYGKISYSG